MGAVSEDCWALIQTMSPAEKAYFKRFGYKSGVRQAAYARLFTAMARMTQYDDASLRRQFSGKAGFSSWSAAKNHLQRQVLQALLDFNAGKSSEDRILQSQREAWLLLERGLDQHAKRRLHAIRKSFTSSEHPRLEPFLLQMEGMLIPYTEADFPKRMQLLEAESANARELASLADYRKLYARMTQIVMRWGVIVRDPKHIQEVEAVLAEGLLQSEEYAHGFAAKYLLHSTNKVLNQVICRYEDALDHAQRCVQLFDRYPAERDRQPEQYIMALNNLLIDLVGLERFGDFDEACALLETYLQGLSAGRLKEESRVNLLGRQLYRRIATREFDQAMVLAKSLEKDLDRFRHQPHIDIQHQYLVACTYAYNERFSDALTRLVSLFRHPQLAEHREYNAFAFILNLIVHFELGNHEHLAHARSAVDRKLQKQGTRFAVEKEILHLLKRLERQRPDAADQLKAFEGTLAAMRSFKADPYERHAFHYFDFTLWLESRLAQQGMLETARRLTPST